jgi:glucokinase
MCILILIAEINNNKHFMENNFRYSLIGDIGGTNSRLELVALTANIHDKQTIIKHHVYESRKLNSISEGIKDFLAEYAGKPEYPKNATLAVAGAVIDGRCKLTNLEHWPALEEKTLSEEFNITPFNLINDFAANGYAIDITHSDSLITVHQPK